MNAQELDALLAGHFAGELSAEEQKLLADALLADESARRRLVEFADQEAALRVLMPGRAEAGRVAGATGAAPRATNRPGPERADSGGPSALPTSDRRAPTTAVKRGWFGWVAAGVAAAALVLVSFLFVSGILPSSSLTLKSFNNTSGAVVEKTLADGTRLVIAPGAKLAAAGRDQSRNIRQLIRLESGEVEVRAPKAPKGEAACRIETVEGLWVETVGTTFKVARTYENEKGERDMDKTKLAGVVITAVLLVAVIEGEVRTGNALAEEQRIAAGGKGVVKAGKDGGKQEQQDERIALDKVPEVVKNAALKAVPGLTLTAAEKETKGSAVTYELKGTANGKTYEVTVSAEGKVLKTKEEPKQKGKKEKDKKDQAKEKEEDRDEADGQNNQAGDQNEADDDDQDEADGQNNQAGDQNEADDDNQDEADGQNNQAGDQNEADGQNNNQDQAGDQNQAGNHNDNGGGGQKGGGQKGGGDQKGGGQKGGGNRF